MGQMTDIQGLKAEMYMIYLCLHPLALQILDEFFS